MEGPIRQLVIVGEKLDSMNGAELSTLLKILGRFGLSGEIETLVDARTLAIGVIPEDATALSVKEKLELNKRGYRILQEYGIETLGHLGKLSRASLSAMPEMGEKTVALILDELDINGWLIPEFSRGTQPEKRLFRYEEEL